MSVYKAEVEVGLNKKGFDEGIKEIGQQTQQTANAIDSRAVAIGNWISDLGKKAGQFFVQQTQLGIEYNAQLETYTTRLTTALGDEAAAAAAIEQIKQDAARTPYSVDGLVEANSYLISAGESAEASRDTILALGDAVAATGGGNDALQRMAVNLQQIKNAGKAAGMDLKQFTNAGINVWGILTDYTGKTREELEKTGVTYEMLTSALQAAASEGGRYFQAMEKQSQTYNGQMSTLKDNIAQLRGEVFSGLVSRLSGDVLPKVNEFVTSLDVSKIKAGLEDVSKGVLAVGTAIATVSFVSWATEVGNVSAAFAKLLPHVKNVVASFQLASEAGYLSAFAGVGAILGVAAIATYDYANGLDNMVDAQRNFNGTASEAAANLRSLTEERNKLKEAIDNGATEASLIDRYNTLNLMIPAAEEAYLRLAHAEDAAGESGDRLAQSSEAASEGMEAIAETSGHTTEEIAALIDYHSKLSDSITKSVNKWFGLFDQAKTSVKVSAKDMMANMQSQIDFNTRYSANLDYLAANGLSNLGSAFQSMGAEGAAYADAIVQAIEEAGGAASEGGQEIINSFNSLASGVEASRGDLSSSLYAITGDLESALAELGVTAEQAAEALNVSGTASASGSASVAAYIAAIAAGSGPAYAAGAKVARAASAGFGSSSGGGRGGIGPAPMAVGCDYIPYDNFPALLHKGEMVIPAKISEDLRDFVGAGGKSSQADKVTTGSGGSGEIISLLRELISVTNRPIVLDSGELVGGIRSKMDDQLGELDGYGRRGLCMA